MAAKRGFGHRKLFRSLLLVALVSVASFLLSHGYLSRETKTYADPVERSLNGMLNQTAEVTVAFGVGHVDRPKIFDKIRNRGSSPRLGVKPPNPNLTQIQVEIQNLITRYPVCRGKEQYLRIILGAKGRLRIPSEQWLCQRLPSVDTVAKRYGPKPVIIGIDRCEDYRRLLRPQSNNGTQIEPMPRVAGLYHTGTNALQRTLNHNLKKLKVSLPIRPYSVPWGKHVPAKYRWTNTFPTDNNDDRTRVLPIVLIRDPFYWMQSMCKENYDATWSLGEKNRCPNLVRSAHNQSTYEVTVATQQSANRLADNYTSLVHLWSEYYTDYLAADYPRLIVRFEDTLYRLEEVFRIIMDCIGVKMTQPFVHEVDTPKFHGQPTDFVSALQKYSSDSSRHRGLNQEDRALAHEVLNPELMRLFGYQHAPMEGEEEDLAGPFEGWWDKDESIVNKNVLKRNKAIHTHLSTSITPTSQVAS